MIYYNHRMIEGSPLRYYPSIYTSTSPTPSYPYFRRFEFDPKMSQDLLMPNSPNSIQSDSDNSISSIDVSAEPIQGKPASAHPDETIETQCCWRSCGIAFESLEKLSEHVSKVHAVSGPGGLYYCGWEGCARNNKGFNARYKMLVHVRTHTNEKPHHCTLCSKSFSRAENLKIHTRSHSGEKPYICPVPGCNKAYSNSSDRFKHTRTHQVEKPYQCKVPGCPKRYTDPSSLRKHVKTFKHFVNENNQVNKNLSEINQRVPSIDKVDTDEKMTRLEPANFHMSTSKTLEPTYPPNATPPRCNCTHSCYLSKCLGINALINIQDKEIPPWNNFIEPYFSDSRRIYANTYDLEEKHMDVDLPLDLSIGRKHI